MKRKLEHAKQAFLKKSPKLDNAPVAKHSGGETQPPTMTEAATLNQSLPHEPRPKESGPGFTKFENMKMDDLLFVEIFAGSAKLSKAARDIGMQVLPVDKTASRASQIYIAQYDLTDPASLQALIDVLRTEGHRILAVHLAPACSTASRAREKKLLSFARKGFKIPGPLRSQQKPMNYVSNWIFCTP